LASKLNTLNFGFKKHYHPIFLYPPVINPEKVKLNLALVEWNVKSGAIGDLRDTTIDDNQDIDQEDENYTQDIDEEDDGEEDGEVYYDAVQDI
jgi:hypothetical protein